MSILGRMKVAAVSAVTSLFVLVPATPVHAAGTISFEYLDGTPLSATVASSESGFTAANEEITSAGYEVVGYIYDDCRQALMDHSDISGDTRLKAVTTRDVSAHGTVGSGVTYFVYNNKLYLTGINSSSDNGSSIEGTGRSGSVNKTDSSEATSVVFRNPDIMSGDIDGAGYGVKHSEIGDEDSVEGNKYYSYVQPEEQITVVQTEKAEEISYDVRISTTNTAGIVASDVPWISFAENITDVYIGDDVALKGSMNFLFNGSDSATTTIGNVPESIYKSLKNVYLFADTSEVTSAAGMFARCPRLENVYVRQDKGVLDLKKCESTAFMFYGDENLINGGSDSEKSAMDAINCMDLSDGVLNDASFMFAACGQIKQPTLTGYNMKNVISTEGMFLGCTNAYLACDASSAVPYNVGTFDLSNCVDTALMFGAIVPRTEEGAVDYDNLTKRQNGHAFSEERKTVVEGSVNLEAMKLTKDVTAYMMFAGNDGITSVRFGNGYPALKSVAGMFTLCSDITSVDMNAAQFPVLTDTQSMFVGTGLNAPGGLVNFAGVSMPVLKLANAMFAYTGFAQIKFDTATDCAALLEAKGMFALNEHLSDLGSKALSHLRFENLEDSSYMFYADDSLSTVATEGWSMEKVKDMSFMFAQSPSLSEGIDISKWKISPALTNMESFANGTDIVSADMSGWNAKNVKSMFMAFANNDALEEVRVPAVSMVALETVNGMFYNDPSLRSVTAFDSCPALKDARGMFAGDTSLESFDGGKLIGEAAKDTSFMFLNCTSLRDVNLTSWNTENVEYMEGMFLSDSILSDIKVSSGFKGKSVVNTARMFEGAVSVKSEVMNEVLSAFSSTPSLVDAKAMFRNMYGLTEIDMSPMDFSKTKMLTSLAEMSEADGMVTNNLTLIRVPATLLSCEGASATDAEGKGIKMFWVDGDGNADGRSEEDTSEDDLLTKFYVSGGNVSDKLASYNLGGTNGNNDNRKFMVFNGRSINGQDTGTFTLSNSDAVLKVDAETTFYVEGSPADLKYDWTKDDKAVEGGEATFKAEAGGAYHVNVLPAVLKGSNTAVDASYVIGGKIQKIVAEYSGDVIPVGDNYSKDDVAVKLIDDTDKEFVLSSGDFAVDSQLVKKVGDNQYVASYKDGAQTLTADFIVPGERHIGFIEAEYTGPSVDVGKDYATDYVITTAYYADDTDKKDGFTVTSVTYSSTTVAQAGDNEFVVTYKDAEQGGKEFSDTITVNGYKPVKSIKAKYTGKDIKVGKKYKKDDVKVTLKYEDGSTEKTTNFQVDSTLVTSAGKNRYTATFTDPYGKTFKSDYKVKGVDEKAGKESSGGDYYSETTTYTETTGGGTGSSYEYQTTEAPSTEGYVSSTVYAPNTEASDYSAYSVSTGLVQTGRTTKGIVAIIICIISAGAVAGALIVKRKMKNGEEV